MTDPNAALHHELRSRPVSVVAIGGSAGGIDALRVLLSALSPEFPVPILVVLHISAETKAAWSHVFSGSALPICEAEDKQRLAPGAVYIAPPGYHLLVDGSGEVSLSVEAAVNLSRPSIDVLLESVAWAYSKQALGIVLSGANADGAAGLHAIARAGGLAWVQSPDTAITQAMPRAALAAVPDARVLTPTQMGEVLGAYRNG